MSSKLDFQQVIPDVHDEANHSLNVKALSGSLITEKYDAISITYVPSGAGAGQIQSVLFYLNGLLGTLQATLTLSYDINNNLISVVKS